jgi:hypothetical protein
MQPIHNEIDQPIRLLYPLQQRKQLAHLAIVLGPQRFAQLPASRIDGQRLLVLPKHRQEALAIVLIVDLDFSLGD